ncbi:glycosyltransferase family 2 protein [Tateyamaria pelophila]|uniref:glycosyltransferase family 2 protein n=1 Tax=Tateyamaria pelophila TaxID=328415 RepID=UPI0021D8D847|nr:glycosyltransferase family 2 protein [Tateyamaria pelophila]
MAQWIKHYSDQIGIENLFVVAHGIDKKVNEIASGANIWTVPRDTVERFDRRRNKMLNDFQSGLLQFYDWVIRVDTDELVCADPDYYSNLCDLLASQSADAVFAMGLNLFEDLDDLEVDDSASVFLSRSSVIITGNYSKAWAVSTDVPLMRHGVKVGRDDELTHTYAFPEATYLVHLKFANIAALADVNETRKSIARSGLPGVPGLGWRKADKHAERFFDTASSMEEMSWDIAVERARIKILSDMKYSEDDGVLRSPGVPYICRTKLPDWFRTR